MKKNPQPSTSNSLSDLRKQAEKRATEQAVDFENMSAEEIRKLVHDAMVHQAELEIQNERLLEKQQALETSHTRYFNLYNHAPIGYFSVNSQGLITDANRTGVTLLGVDKSMIENKSFSSFIKKGDRKKYTNMVKKAIKSQIPQTIDIRLLSPARSEFPVQIQFVPIEDKDGDTDQYGITISDIEASKEKQDKLISENQWRKEFLETVLETDPSGIAVLSGQELEFKLVNPAFRSITPNPEIDPVGKTFDEIWSRGEARRSKKIYKKVIDTKEPIFIERYERRFPDGSTRYFSFNIQPFHWDGESAVLAVLWDITSLENARQQAEELAVRDKAILENMNEGLVIFDSRGNTIDVNPYALQLAGFSSKKKASKHLDDISDYFRLETPNGRSMPVDEWPMSRVMRGESISNVEARVWCLNIGDVWIGSFNGNPIRDRDGKMIFGIITVRNITEQKEAESERKWLFKELESERTRMKTIVDNAPEAIVLADENAQIIMTNPAADYLYSRPVPYGENYESHTTLQLCYPDGTPYDPRNLPLTRSALDGETVNNLEILIIWENGQQKNLLVTTTPFFDHEGHINGAIGIFRDITERKLMEKALQQSHDELEERIQERTAELMDANKRLKYQADLLANVHDAIIAIDNDKKITFWNHAAEELYGLMVEKALGTDGTQFFFSENPDNSREDLFHKLRKFEHWRGEVEQMKTDHTPLFCDVNAIALKGDHGQIIGYVTVNRDITEHKKIQQTLTQQRELLQKTFDNIPIMICVYDPEGKLRLINKEFERLLGYSFEELKELDLMTTFYPDPEYRQQVWDFMTNATSEWRDFKVKTRKGNDLDSAWSNIRLSDGSHIGIGIDIREQKQKEQELKVSEQRFRTLIESMNDTMFTLDSESRFMDIFGPWSEQTGVPAQKCIGKPIQDVLEPNEAVVYDDVLNRVMSGESVTYEWHRNLKDRTIYIENQLSPLRNTEGTVEGVMGIGRDTTKKKTLEKQLVYTEKLVTVAEMSAMISHEFRNSLSSVRMILELQSESDQIPVEEKKPVGIALDSINHMESIVTQLLNFTHPRPIELKPSDLNGVIEESLDFVDMEMSKKGVKLKKSLDASLSGLKLDEENIKKTIINLLLNAIQAVEENDQRGKAKKVSISTKKRKLWTTIRDVPARKIDQNDVLYSTHELILPKGTKCALIEIGDNGVGIEEKNLVRIFDPFFTTKKKGTGLGLSMVKHTVNAHGGIIWIDSRPGKGTTFTIFLTIEETKK